MCTCTHTEREEERETESTCFFFISTTNRSSLKSNKFRNALSLGCSVNGKKSLIFSELQSSYLSLMI